MADRKDETYARLVRAEKDRLFGLSDSELRSLPAYSTIVRTEDDISVEVGIWHQLHPDGFDVLVAQSKRYIFWGYGHMFVEGFILTPDGRRDRLPDQVYYEYA